ncbi:MAG: RluA family pseudouridine synthase [Treponemataceae bacterium]
MDFERFTVTKNDENRRLDKVVCVLTGFQNSLVCKNIRTGFIRLNGKKADFNSKVVSGDSIEIEKHFFSQIKKRVDSNADFKFPFTLDDIKLFENEHILVVNKPYGILCQSNGSKELSLDKLVQSHFSSASLSFKTGPLHRLDKNTTGILCFSQSLQGARWFSKCMQEKLIKKTYVAVVQGNLKENVVWQDYLEKTAFDKSFYKSRVSDSSSGKLAITKAFPLSYADCNGFPITFVKFDIPTGKNHQIRLQSALHGFPLLADTAYGGNKNYANMIFDSHFLHCIKVEFPENDLGIPRAIICEIPSKFALFAKNCLLDLNFCL